MDFTFDVDTLRITCIFVNTTQMNPERSCTVMFGLGHDLSSCRNLSQSLRSEQKVNVSRIAVNLPIFLIKLTSNDVCLVVRASNNRHTVDAERMLTVVSGILNILKVLPPFEGMVMITFNLCIYLRL